MVAAGKPCSSSRYLYVPMMEKMEGRRKRDEIAGGSSKRRGERGRTEEQG